MNEIEFLRQLNNDYKRTTSTLFDMLDEFLEKPQKTLEVDKSSTEQTTCV